jgi:ubiquinone/menaquinone biosynthesis C-methylase UbiE
MPILLSLARSLGTALLAALAAAALAALFFFATTRAALLWRGRRLDAAALSARGRVYPIYTEGALIRLVDHQFLIAAILLGQYRALVDRIVEGMAEQQLDAQTVLVTACAFGDVVPRVAAAAARGRAARLQVLDLYATELDQVRRKLRPARPGPALDLRQGDACASGLPDASVAVNVLFFLLHELPPAQQQQALDEACRVLAPGGMLYLAEFHRPRARLLRAAGWLYFHVFEPWGLLLWAGSDPARALAARADVRLRAQHLRCAGNYQLLIAEKV